MARSFGLGSPRSVLTWQIVRVYDLAASSPSGFTFGTVGTAASNALANISSTLSAGVSSPGAAATGTPGAVAAGTSLRVSGVGETAVSLIGAGLAGGRFDAAAATGDATAEAGL